VPPRSCAARQIVYNWRLLFEKPPFRPEAGVCGFKDSFVRRSVPEGTIPASGQRSAVPVEELRRTAESVDLDAGV